MPEAAIDEDSDLCGAENDIGSATQTAEWRHVDSVPEAGGVEKPPDRELRTGITGALTLHPVAHCWRACPGRLGSIWPRNPR
jgi:hypothetical protein